MTITLNGTTGVTAPALTGSIDASNLTGVLPAIDGSSLTGIDTTPTTAGVLTATAGATAGAVGTYAFLSRTSGVSSGTRLGAVLSGSSLKYASTRNGLDIDNMAYVVATSIPSGTWMAMGDTGDTLVNYGLCVWLRIS